MRNSRNSSSWGECSLSILHAGDKLLASMESWMQTPLEILPGVCPLRLHSSSSLDSRRGGFARVVSFRAVSRTVSTSPSCCSALLDRFLFLDGESPKSSSMVFSGQAIITSNTEMQAEFRLDNLEGTSSSCKCAMILILACVNFFRVSQSTARRLIKAEM